MLSFFYIRNTEALLIVVELVFYFFLIISQCIAVAMETLPCILKAIKMTDFQIKYQLKFNGKNSINFQRYFQFKIV